ncbi:type II secretion system major pseudopilin GspG [Wenzhouxiangella limi]|uniref:Type II secretion system core protein G n=1 Tax=Wenzhouxiangella limi TaxID=2707351 RepID=A0A845UY28_9GAMM|nr:type II secretion system major pseudopilin GspG [Wenzhouxiangella limi]NDY96327.1 type II secretion system major pseudopilin GspG [Wenzhouxiangella limi]
MIKKSIHTNSRGFTLLEMLVVLVIIALIVGLVGPRLFTRVDYSRVDTAETQVRMLRGALETFRLDVGRFPTQEEGLNALFSRPSDERVANRWRGPYIDEPPPEDPWGNPYRYSLPGRDLPFALYSYGADGRPGGEDVNADVGYLPRS